MAFPVCIFGDFNLRKIIWSMLYQTGTISKITSLEQSLLDFINLNHLKQHNLIENDICRMLNLVMSDVPACIVNNSSEVLS